MHLHTEKAFRGSMSTQKQWAAWSYSLRFVFWVSIKISPQIIVIKIHVLVEGLLHVAPNQEEGGEESQTNHRNDVKIVYYPFMHFPT